MYKISSDIKKIILFLHIYKMSISEERKKFTIKNHGNDTTIIEERPSLLEIPILSTKEMLHSNHTQFVFIRDSQQGHSRTNAAAECRTAFEKFLLSICRVNSGTILYSLITLSDK